MNGDKIRRNRFSHTDVTELAERVRAEKSCIPPLPEGSMRSLMKQKELECWREENRLALESYNAMIEWRGLLSDDIGLL